jgi:ribosome maturation factor RimP
MEAMGHGVKEAVRSLAAKAAEGEGMDLVDLEFRREPVGWVLRLFIDKQGGVTVGDCQRMSEVVGTLLEVEDPIPHAYTLEVSSPGLTRPLQSDADWERSIGALVRIVTRAAVEGRQAFVGRLLDARKESVTIDVDGDRVELPRDSIAKARREVEWPAAPQGTKREKGRGGRGQGSSRGQASDDGK